MIDEVPDSDESPENEVSDSTSESPSNGDMAGGANEVASESDASEPSGDEVAADEKMEEVSDPQEHEPGGGDDESEDESEDESARRSFLTQVLAGTIGAVVGLVPVLSGLVFFLDPLIRGGEGAGASGEGGGSSKDAEGFIKLPVTRALLPADGTPQQVTIEDDLVDAWNKFPKVPIGSVWLRRSESGEVVAFNTVCPHLGCAVEFRGAKNDFYCPCHLSAFKLDGTKDNPIPPRDMDGLAVKPNTGEEIWVQYKNFRGGISEKVET